MSSDRRFEQELPALLDDLYMRNRIMLELTDALIGVVALVALVRASPGAQGANRSPDPI